MTEEEIQCLIQHCGSIGLFASRYRSIIPVLRKVKDAWPELDTVFFAFMHMFCVTVPEPYIQYSRDVWCRFYAADKNIRVFVRDMLLTYDQFNKLMLADKVNLESLIVEFLAYYVQGHLDKGTCLRNSQEAAEPGKPCTEFLCVCTQFQYNAIPLEEEIRALAETTRELYGKPTKRARDFPEFSDSEDGEGEANIGAAGGSKGIG